MAGNRQIFSDVTAVEQRARGFQDPIERLKYLRGAAGSGRRGGFWKRWAGCAAIAMMMMALRSDATNREPQTRKPLAPAIVRTAYHSVPGAPNIWPVEQTRDYDLYSNGLRIENRLAISNEPRSYHLIARGSGEPGPRRDQPAGIVFHTSESDQAPFEREHKTTLQRIGQELLLYVRNKRAYHFVIDRFGRVHRLVVESDSANHAGHSVWADSKWSYINLNESFLGVAFEASMQTGQTIVTDAQLRAARALTEMLRAKYNLPAENCVVHAQVSVNPSNWRIGWHTDWGVGFPFREVGLPENYQIPNPSLYLFGFEYDPAYTSVTGPDLWNGLTAAEERVREAAAERGMTPAEYQKILRQKFRDAVSAVQNQIPVEENQNESK
jgi:hypothetical protein